MPVANPENLEFYMATLVSMFEDTRTTATNELGMLFTEKSSSSRLNRYYWRNQRTTLREWIGDRQAVSYSTIEYVVENKPFERTVEVSLDDFEDDELGVYDDMTKDMALAVEEQPDDQAVDLLQNYASYTCYDGLPFFDDAHPIDPAGDPTGAKFGTFSNLLTSTALNVDNYIAAKAAFRQFKGSDGRPLGGRHTHLIVPPQLEDVGKQILEADMIARLADAGATSVGVTNTVRNDAQLVVSDKLGDEDDVWYLARIGGGMTPLIHQVRRAPVFTSITDLTSEAVFKRRKLEFGVDLRVGFGYRIPQLMMRCEA